METKMEATILFRVYVAISVCDLGCEQNQAATAIVVWV